ncbi:glycosyltransferase family 4 protein [Candidatus Puniceispirillum sp.]|nr:glycosyltransferase family 4 protein [Candidatus Puniceispirillum sp.]
MKILLITEEYEKLTVGMFNVWSTFCKNLHPSDEVTILLNKEHWFASLKHNADCKEKGSKKLQDVVSCPFLVPLHQVEEMFQGIGNKNLQWFLRLLCLLVNEIVFLPKIAIWFLYILRSKDFDVIVFHHGGWPAGAFVRHLLLLGWIFGAKNRCLVLHSFPSPYSKRLKFLELIQERLIGRAASKILTVSKAASAALSKRNFMRPIYVVYNGIQTIEKPVKKINKGSALPLVGFLGAFVPTKGAHVLIEAGQYISSNCKLELLGKGDPSYLRRLEGLAGLQPYHCKFSINEEDIEAFLKNIDILVVPSIDYEAFGMVILEAMVHKKPVICSDFGGMKEIVLDGVTGRVVRANDPVVLGRAINDLLTSPTVRKKMGQEGYKRVKTLFTVDKMMDSYYHHFR